MPMGSRASCRQLSSGSRDRKALLFNYIESHQWVGLSACQHHLEIKACTEGNRSREEEEGEPLDPGFKPNQRSLCHKKGGGVRRGKKPLEPKGEKKQGNGKMGEWGEGGG